MTPRLVDRIKAAEYVGLSPSGYDNRVDDGTFPPAIKIGKRRLWDLRVIDKTIDDMSGLNDDKVISPETIIEERIIAFNKG